MRRMTDRQSFMFSLSISLEAEDGLTTAEILNMEDQLAVSGRTEDEAVENARRLFMATVDDAMARGASIQFSTGQQPIALDIPIWQAPRFFHILEAHLNQEADEEDQEWLNIPLAQIFKPQHAE